MATFSNASLIESMRALGVSATDVPDSDLIVIIENALDEYNEYKPNIKMTTSLTCLTTVADQPNYSFPDDALWITGVCWNAEFNENVNSIIEDVKLASLGDATMSDFWIYYNNIRRIKENFGGKWEIINDEIYLYPTPTTSGTKVAVFYATENTIESLNTITNRIFRDLVYGLCLERSAIERSKNAGYTAGSYKVDKGVADQAIKHASEKLKQVRHRMSNAYYGTRT